MAGPESEHIYGVQLRESADDGSDFSSADADYRILFLGEDGDLHTKDSAGSVAAIGGGGGVGNMWTMSLSSSQTLTNNTDTTITWNRTDIDGGGSVIDLANDRFAAPATGFYMAFITWLWETTAPVSGARMQILVGGSGQPAIARVPAMTPATAVYSADSGYNASFPLTLTSGDLVTATINPGAVTGCTARGNAARNLSTCVTLVRIT